MIRLYVIEDHSSIIVPGLKRLFYSSRDGINVAGASESVEAAILEADPDSFDIFIFDLWLKNKLPIQNIQELVKHLRMNLPKADLLFLVPREELNCLKK